MEVTDPLVAIMVAVGVGTMRTECLILVVD